MIMKYFSRDFCSWALSEQEQDDRLAGYKDRLKEVWPILPNTVKVLNSHPLQDSIVDYVLYDDASSRLEIGLISGDLQVGYRLMIIVYRGANLTDISYRAIVAASVSEDAEIAFDEWDVVENENCVHRVILFHGGEFEVYFTALEYSESPRVDRKRSRQLGK